MVERGRIFTLTKRALPRSCKRESTSHTYTKKKKTREKQERDEVPGSDTFSTHTPKKFPPVKEEAPHQDGAPTLIKPPPENRPAPWKDETVLLHEESQLPYTVRCAPQEP